MFNLVMRCSGREGVSSSTCGSYINVGDETRMSPTTIHLYRTPRINCNRYSLRPPHCHSFYSFNLIYIHKFICKICDTRNRPYGYSLKVPQVIQISILFSLNGKRAYYRMTNDSLFRKYSRNQFLVSIFVHVFGTQYML